MHSTNGATGASQIIELFSLFTFIDRVGTWIERRDGREQENSGRGNSGRRTHTPSRCTPQQAPHNTAAVFSTSSIFADTQLSVTRQNRLAISPGFISKPRMAGISYNGAFKCQEKDRRRCLKRDLAHCGGKSSQPEPETGPINNTCPTTDPPTEPEIRSR